MWKWKVLKNRPQGNYFINMHLQLLSRPQAKDNVIEAAFNKRTTNPKRQQFNT
jgi:hypothetical protein